MNHWTLRWSDGAGLHEVQQTDAGYQALITLGIALRHTGGATDIVVVDASGKITWKA